MLIKTRLLNLEIPIIIYCTLNVTFSGWTEDGSWPTLAALIQYPAFSLDQNSSILKLFSIVSLSRFPLFLPSS